VARDQLTEAIEAALTLRNGGKTVHADAERPVQMIFAGPNFADGSLAKEAVEAGIPERKDA
jgi:hypothetical protein